MCYIGRLCQGGIYYVFIMVELCTLASSVWQLYCIAVIWIFFRLHNFKMTIISQVPNKVSYIIDYMVQSIYWQSFVANLSTQGILFNFPSAQLYLDIYHSFRRREEESYTVYSCWKFTNLHFHKCWIYWSL